MAKRTPKVLFYAPSPPPYAGPEVATAALLDGWQGDRTQLIHVRANIRDDNARKGVLDLQGLWRMGRNYLHFLWVLCWQRPAVVYLLLSSGKVGFLRDTLLVASAKLFRRKVVAHYRGGNFHGFYASSSGAMQRVIRWCLRRTDRVIIQARCLAFMFDGLVPSDRIAVLYNGIDPNNVPCRPRNFAAPVTLLFMGHVAHSKGFYDLIQAYRQLHEFHPVKLLVAGTRIRDPDVVRGWLTGAHLDHYDVHHAEIEAAIDQFLANADQWQADYLGVVPSAEKYRVFDRADLLVLPSYTEGFSMTVLEAMTAGLAVVVTDVGAFPEVVQPGRNGWLLKAGDSDALHKVLHAVLNDPASTAAVAQQNRTDVEQNYTVPHVRQQLEEILLQSLR